MSRREASGGAPRLALALARRRVPEEIAEAVQGDLEEGWRARVERHGRLRARIWIWGEVLRLRGGALRRVVGRLREDRWRSVRGMAHSGWTTRRGGIMGVMGRGVEDVRVAVRGLRRRPGFAAVVVATLALSVGAATLVFSVAEAVLLRPLPYPEADRLVDLHTVNEAWRTSEEAHLREWADRYFLSLEQVEAVRRVPGLASVGAVATGGAVLRTEEGARRIPWAMVSPGLLRTLGRAPLLGRLPSENELESGARVAVLSHGFWTDALGRDPEALGATLGLEGEEYVVVGVMPPDFWFPDPARELWVPLPEGLQREGRSLQVLSVVGRLAEGARPETVEREADARVRQLAAGGVEAVGTGIRVALRRDAVVEGAERGLALLAGAVALVVLLASVNLATLVLARASRRGGELAVRRALGGGRWAVGWSLLAEVVVLCLLGGAAGVVLAYVALEPFVASLRSLEILQGIRASVNGPVLGAAAATTLLAALGAGLPVAWRATRSWPAEALVSARSGGTSAAGRRTLRGLLVAESGLAFVLLAGAVLLLRTLGAMAAVDPGYDPRGLAFVSVTAAGGEGGPDAVEAVEVFHTLVEAVGGDVGGAAALVEPLPLAGSGTMELVRPTDREASLQVGATRVGPAFISVAGMSVVRGRGIEAADDAGAAAVALVSERLARELGRDGEVLGREVDVGQGEKVRRATVVGVVADARMLALPVEADARIYLPLAQFPTGSATVVVREAGPAPGSGLEEAVRQAGGEDLIVERSGTLHGAAWSILAPLRVRAALVGALALLALVLAAVGVVGVAAFVVEARTREIGIRMALGARPGGETRRVTLSFLGTVALGTGLGLAASLALSRVMDAFLYEMEALDPLSYAVAVTVLPALGALAAWIPARRAASVDPVEVLKGE